MFLAVALGLFLSSLDQTNVATALPAMVADFGGAGYQSQVVTSYLLAMSISTVIAGKVGDLFGRKKVFQAALLVFLIGSMLCGLAQSMTMLIGSRALQGLGGGAVLVTATALIGEVVPLRDRGRYQGLLGAVYGISTVIGPLLGGFFTDNLTWRWLFWLNLPLGAVVIFVTAATIPALTGTAKPSIDYLGIVLIGLGTTGLTLATSWGGASYPWGSPIIVGLFGASAVVLAMFVWVELHAAEPILPLRLFANQVFTICCVLSFIVGFALLGGLIYMPTYLQFVDGVSATESGMRELPMVAGLLLTSIGSGTLVARMGRYKIFPVLGTAIMVVGFLLLSEMRHETPVLTESIYLFVLGAGIGMCGQILVLAVQNSADFADLGAATSGVTFFRAIGSSFGAAVFGTLFINFFNDRIGPALAVSGAPASAAQSPSGLHQLTHEMAEPIVDVYTESLGAVFFWAAPVAMVGMIVALFLKEVPLRDIGGAAPSDLGEGFALPRTQSPAELLENSIGRLMRNEPPDVRLTVLVARAGCELDVVSMWALLQLYRHAQAFGTARVGDIAVRRAIPRELLDPVFEPLVDSGYAQIQGDSLVPTAAGLRQLGLLRSVIVDWTMERLGVSTSIEGNPGRADVQSALERVMRRILVERDWGDASSR